MRKLPETITESELIGILKRTPEIKYRLSYALGFYQCLRVSEIINLKPEDVDEGQRLLLIKQAKGKKDRNIPIAPQVYKIVKKALPINVGIRMLQKRFNKITKEVLGKSHNFHILRHSGASYYLNIKKWDIRQVQVFLGHSNIVTTQIYTHVNPQDLVNRMWDNE